jgi:hypothetical protein
MKKHVFFKFLAFSLVFLGFITPAYAQDQNLPTSTKKIQRSFLNLSFEQFTDSSPIPPEKGWPSSPWAIYKQEQVIGWRSTARKKDNNGNALTYRGIEIWNEKRIGKATSKASNGDYYAELNAHVASRLYQNVCLLQDDTFTWSLDHMPRSSNSESMKFVISDSIDDNGATNTDGDLVTTGSKQVGGEIKSPTVGTWKTYNSNGVVNASGYLNGQEAAVKAFGFEAITGGNIGNFIDNLKVKLRPAVEFLATSGESFEKSDQKYHSVDFKILGLVEGDITVSFVIDSKTALNGVSVAKYGTDYKIYSKVGEVYTNIPVTLNKETGQLEFIYTVKYNPALDYAQGVIVKGLVVELIDNNLLDGDKIIPFGLNSIQSGSVKIMGTEVCGTAPISEFSYKILDNDTDLAVTKTLLDTEIFPSKTVSYDIIVENKSTLKKSESSTALDVVLKDTLTSNLLFDESTEVTCEVIENEEVKGICPVTTSAKVAAQQLFSNQGLVIGRMPAKSKLKFTVSKLKVTDVENGQNNYKNFIVNKAQVTTTSNDVDLSNNETTVSTSYPFLTDLSNHVSGSFDDTGIGIFYIAEGGRTGTVPLLTKSTDNTRQVYFPLKIENKAPYSQDYKLHASKTAISTLRTGEYSGLDASSISAYTSGLDIKFYLAEQGQCKAGLTANIVSQISINANTSAQLCAQITASDLAESSNPIWFAIESLQTGLGDIIKNEVITKLSTLRQLTLVNDQQAQVNIGGTYVFAHRLSNEGSITENNLQFKLEPLSANDDFSYSLFLDHNNNGVLDTGDEQVNANTVIPSVAVGERLNLLVKAQAPSTATNGMRSQVKIIVTPTHNINDILLDTLINTDTVLVGSNQLVLQKTQFKQTGCVDMLKDQVQAANYSLGQMSIGRNDCIIYRIEASNIGAEKLTSIVINDMYPHYSKSWSSNGTLPMTDSGDKVTQQGDKVETKISQLLPGEKKSLYFGITLH